MNKDILKCRICGHDNNNESVDLLEATCMFLDKEKLIRYKCNDCGVIFGTEKILNMPEDDLSSLYEKLYQTYSEPDLRGIQNFNISLAYKHLNDYNETVLNWGAGKYPVAKPFNEINHSKCIDYDIVKFHDYMINDLDNIEDESLGAIVSNNVIEHFQHPVDALKKMNKMLKPNGFMVHSTAPIGKYICENTRFHTFFYTGNSIEVLAEKSGFKIVDYNYITDSGRPIKNRSSIGDYVSVVFKKL